MGNNIFPSKLQKIIVFLIIILDQLTKLLVRKSFFLYESRPVTSFLSLTYIHNTGMAWGFFQGKAYSNIAFIFIMLFILACFAFFYKQITQHGGKLSEYAITLVFGGALGNLIDRIFLGNVVDFIDFHFFPVFNVADSCISVGGVMLFISFLVRKKQIL
ncbi:MAG: signal peptidase II [Elusimicrobia bacterium RIFOXYB2_FULL_48_7]|nr:MAG: signal peptidase II [Elusimicrobia bacterium RIFOXYB2_FULL_48_7]